jgi:hypothetical protein
MWKVIFSVEQTAVFPSAFVVSLTASAAILIGVLTAVSTINIFITSFQLSTKKPPV